VRADEFLAALADLPVAGLDALAGQGGLVVVAPHPDDESLGCGGLMVQALRAGRAVRVVILSDGCGSHPNSQAYPAERLRAQREAETLRAVAELGLDPACVTFLRLPDGAVPHEGAPAQAVAERIAGIAEACGAGAVLTTWGGDPHCDHKGAAAIVALARPLLKDARTFAYPIWGWVLPPETEVGLAPSGIRLDVRGERAAKRRAVYAHTSQTTGLIDDPPGFRLEEAIIDRLCGPYEWYVETNAETDAGTRP